MFDRCTLVFIAVVICAIGCTRSASNGDKSLLRLTLPKSATPTAKAGEVRTSSMDLTKSCFVINVTGEGIPSPTNGCGMNVGTLSAMVPGGGDIALDVKKGPGRRIELYRYNMGVGDTQCPAWNPSDCSSPVMCGILKAGVTEGINVDGAEVNVSITLDLTGATPISTAALCATGQVRVALRSDGDISKGDGTSLAAVLTDVKALSVSINNGTVETWNSCGESNSALIVPSYVRSVTRKPDSGQLFGLIGTNELVLLNGSGSWSSIENCPFETCTVPPFMETVSAGYDKRIYGFDMAGGVYKLSASAPQKLQDLSPVILHAVYY